MSQEKTIIDDTRLEKHVILLCLINNQLFDRVKLDEDDFITLKNEWINVTAYLEKHGQVSLSSNLDFDTRKLLDPMDPWISPNFIDEYCLELRERNIIRGVKQKESIDEMKDLIAKEYSLQRIDRKGIISRVMDDYAERQVDLKSVSLATEYPWIDDKVVLRNGDLITIAGRPGTGKSVSALNIAMRISKTGKKVLFCSLEMSEDEVFFRALAASQAIPHDQIISGKVADFPGMFAKYDADYKNLTIVHPRKMETKDLRRMLDKYDCVFVDQLSNLRDPYQGKETKAALYGRITQKMNAFCKETGKSIFLCAQINRMGTVDPQLEHLKDSGSIEEDSAVVLLLSPDKDQKGVLWMKAAKNRHGQTGVTGKFTMRPSFCQLLPFKR
jgi:replicative DNA helicase